MKNISSELIALKKQLLLLRINTVVLNEDNKKKEIKIKKAIAILKSGRTPSILPVEEVK